MTQVDDREVNKVTLSKTQEKDKYDMYLSYICSKDISISNRCQLMVPAQKVDVLLLTKIVSQQRNVQSNAL